MLLELQLPCSTKTTNHCTHTETHTRAPAAKNYRGWEKNGAITRKQIKTEPYVHQHTQTTHITLLYVCADGKQLWSDRYCHGLFIC